MEKLTLSLTQSEFDILKSAQQVSSAIDLETFARTALLERAAAIMQLAPGPVVARRTPRPSPETLHAYIGETLPKDSLLPATLFPSMRCFASYFADDVREALRALAQHEPETIKEFSRRFPSYSYEKLSRDLRRLSDHGLVGYDYPSDHRMLSPRLLHPRVKLIIPLRSQTLAQTLHLAVASAPDEKTPAPVDKTFTAMEKIHSFLTDKSLELLGAIGAKNPKSIMELALMTGRDHRNVHPTIRKLTRDGLVRIEGPQPTKAVLLYDAITLDLVFDKDGPK
jgi:predicted transcriptional regulator